MQVIPAQPNSSPMAGSIISVCASGMVLANPSPAPCPVIPPVEIAQMPLATWSPPYTWLFHASDQIAFLSISLCIGPGTIFASTGILSSNKNPLTTTNAITADSLNFFFESSMYSARAATATPVASQAFLKIQIAIAYKIIAATTCKKSPLEKEKSMIKVKQQTMAGPRSPNAKNNKIVVTMAMTANTKNDTLLLKEGYSEMNFSFVAKKPARKIMTRYLTISLG